MANCASADNKNDEYAQRNSASSTVSAGINPNKRASTSLLGSHKCQLIHAPMTSVRITVSETMSSALRSGR